MQASTCAKIALTSYNADVYEPSDDSFALVDALAAQSQVWGPRRPRTCVEVGCGSGYVICSAALMLQARGAECACFATDISHHALAATSETLRSHGLGHAVDLVRTDLLAAFRGQLRGRVDLLLFNPPYVVTPDEELLRPGVARAWAGGADGRVVIDRMLADVDHFLSPTGLLYMIVIEDNKPQDIVRSLRQEGGLEADIVLSRRADEELIHVLQVSRPLCASTE